MNEFSGQDVGTQRRSHQTEPKANVLTGRSKFPMSHIFPTSVRYGEISPFYYQHGIGDDTIPLYSEHALRTHTLSSPVESEVQMQKTYFSVPMDAIYPLNWDKMQVNPSHGDDVPDDTRCCFPLIGKVSQVHNKFKTYLNDLSDTVPDAFVPVILQHIFFLESIFSNGSLFAQFNIHFSPLIRFIDEAGTNRSKSFDDWLDLFYPSFFENFIYSGDSSPYFMIDGLKYGYTGEIVGESFTGNGVRFVNLHQLLDLLRHESFTIENTPSIDLSVLVNGDDYDSLADLVIDSFNQPINLEVIISYQLGCFQYFSDSRIDDIFDANRFRGLISSLLRSLLGQSLYPAYYSYNGDYLQYDVFSARSFNSVFEAMTSAGNPIADSYFLKLYDFFKLFFTFRNSLRFGDYFITARLRQYGVGNTTIDTSSGSVSALDITKNIQMQRFLQSVSWAKSTVKDYVRDVLGIQKSQTPRKDVPMFIASDRFRVDGYEVENTGSEQRDVNSITTLVKTKQGKFAFEFEPENQCIIIGVMHFDVERIYSKGVDRMHTHQNRFDDVIPEMQFVGDQEIRKNEFDVSLGDGVFGWTLRYMPYKIRINYAAGAFVNHLKSWLMITDNKDGNTSTGSIDSRYLRSNPAEFDRFYTSLTGCSLATYYHFIVVNRNYQDLTRDLVYAPEPLK